MSSPFEFELVDDREGDKYNWRITVKQDLADFMLQAESVIRQLGVTWEEFYATLIIEEIEMLEQRNKQFLSQLEENIQSWKDPKPEVSLLGPRTLPHIDWRKYRA